MNCPRCQSELESLSNDVAVHGCRSCRGAFFDNLASQLLVKNQLPAMVQYTYAMSGETVPEEEAEEEPKEGPFRSPDVPAPSCPACGKAMRPMVASGVSIDVCAEHGTWMDAGEGELIRKLRAFDKALKVAQKEDAHARSVAASAYAAEQAAAAYARVERRIDDRDGRALADAIGALMDD